MSFLFCNRGRQRQLIRPVAILGAVGVILLCGLTSIGETESPAVDERQTDRTLAKRFIGSWEFDKRAMVVFKETPEEARVFFGEANVMFNFKADGTLREVRRFDGGKMFKQGTRELLGTWRLTAVKGKSATMRWAMKRAENREAVATLAAPDSMVLHFDKKYLFKGFHQVILKRVASIEPLANASSPGAQHGPSRATIRHSPR